MFSGLGEGYIGNKLVKILLLNRDKIPVSRELYKRFERNYEVLVNEILSVKKIMIVKFRHQTKKW